jgi:hypothetical protein
MPDNQNQQISNDDEKNEITEYYEGVKQLEMQGYESGIKNARTALFVTAALLFAGELISAAISEIPFTFLFWIIILIQSGVFVALGFWTKTKPYAAIITGLVFFILIWALAIALSGFRGALGGVIVKVIIIVYLAKAIGPAKAWEDSKRNI